MDANTIKAIKIAGTAAFGAVVALQTSYVFSLKSALRQTKHEVVIWKTCFRVGTQKLNNTQFKEVMIEVNQMFDDRGILVDRK